MVHKLTPLDTTLFTATDLVHIVDEVHCTNQPHRVRPQDAELAVPAPTSPADLAGPTDARSPQDAAGAARDRR